LAEVDEKQKLLIEFLISSKELFVKCGGIINPEYFESPLNVVMGFVMKYYTQYHNIPDVSIIFAETEIDFTVRDVQSHEFDYITDEIEKFCREEAFKMVLIEGSDMIAEDEEPDFGKIDRMFRDAIMISIDKDMGIDYFDDPAERLARMQEHIDSRSIGWPSLDMVSDKCRRGELVMFAGNSGAGKSVVLANVAANFAADGLNSLVLSLELGEDLITKRMDSIITGIHTKDVFDSVEDIVNILKKNEKSYGSIVVKKLSISANSNDIRAYLTEYEIQFGYKPDCVCVDYLDQMGTNEKSNDGVFEKDKQKTEELREIFVDYNAYGFTASQLNRESVDTEHKSQAHIAGGISKINTSDVAWGLIHNEEQQDNNELHFQAMKLRNSEFSTKPVVLYWDKKTLKISDKPNQSSSKNSPKSKADNKLKAILDKKKKK